MAPLEPTQRLNGKAGALTAASRCYEAAAEHLDQPDAFNALMRAGDRYLAKAKGEDAGVAQ